MDKKLPVDAYAAARPIDTPFLLLASLFVAALLVCTLLDADALVVVDLGFREVPVGLNVLPYPATFFVTDLLSEVYGRRRALRVVTVAFAAAALVVGVQWLVGTFGQTWVHPYKLLVPATAGDLGALFGTATAYLAAQYIDVWLFHGARALTKGRLLWLRLNVSTLVSLPIAVALGLFVTFRGDPAWPTERMLTTCRDAWIFALPLVLASTPLCYAGAWLLRRWRPRPL